MARQDMEAKVAWKSEQLTLVRVVPSAHGQFVGVAVQNLYDASCEE